jgi:hypothetical protein
MFDPHLRHYNWRQAQATAQTVNKHTPALDQLERTSAGGIRGEKY